MPPIDPNASQNNPAMQPQTPPVVSPPPVPSAVPSVAPVAPQTPATAPSSAASPQLVVPPATESIAAASPPPPITPPQSPMPAPQTIPAPLTPEPTIPQPQPDVIPPQPELAPAVTPQPVMPVNTVGFEQSAANPITAAQVAPQAAEPLVSQAAGLASNQATPPYGAEAVQDQANLATPLNANTAAELGQAPPAVPESTPPKSHKKLFIIIGAAAVVLALAGGAWALAGMPGLSKAPTSSTSGQGLDETGTGDASSFNPDATTDGGQDGSATTDSGSAASTTKSVVYGMVSRPCFSFSLPTPNTASKDGTCKVDAVFGNPSTSKILILPSTATFSSLESALAIAKQTYKLTSPVDKKIKLGGLDAYETTYTTTSGKKAVKIIVGTVGRNYTFGTAKVSGFEINLPATSSVDLAAVAELIKTWTWK